MKNILDMSIANLKNLSMKIKGMKGRSKITSNTRNTNPSKKNCLLIGIRLVDTGSNPHSNGGFNGFFLL